MTFEGKSDSFQVVVGNVGTVFAGAEKKARQEFNEWKRLAIAKQGRASGENVTLLNDRGDIVREYVGRIARGESF